MTWIYYNFVLWPGVAQCNYCLWAEFLGFCFREVLGFLFSPSPYWLWVSALLRYMSYREDKTGGAWNWMIISCLLPWIIMFEDFFRTCHTCTWHGSCARVALNLPLTICLWCDPIWGGGGQFLPASRIFLFLPLTHETEQPSPIFTLSERFACSTSHCACSGGVFVCNAVCTMHK